MEADTKENLAGAIEMTLKNKVESKKDEENTNNTVQDEPPPPPDIMESTVGAIGRWQIIICLAISLVKVPVAWHQLGIIFLAPNVEAKCLNLKYEYEDCPETCLRYEYESPIFNSTIVMEWELVCQREWMKKMTQTIFMLGVLLGNMLFGILADKYGRRKPLLLAVVAQAVIGIFAAYSWDWYSFTIIRFFLAMFNGGSMTISFVIAMEMVGVKYRQIFGLLYQVPFILGHASLAGIAYLTTDSWSSLQFWISLPTFILLLYYWLIPESPRWLLAFGRTDEAINILEKGAQDNKMPIEDIGAKVLASSAPKTDDKDTPKPNILSLFRTPNMRKKTIYLSFGWFICGICFYGLSQYVSQLRGDIFINVAMSALIQLPGTVGAIVLNQKFGRKKSMIGAYVTSAVFLLGIALVPENMIYSKTLNIVFAFIGIFGTSIYFSTIYIFAGELFPTVLRNTGMGWCAMLSRVGSMLAPFVAGLDKFVYWLPPLMFGIMLLLAAGLTLLLPETHGKAMPNTVEEAEEFGIGDESKS